MTHDEYPCLDEGFWRGQPAVHPGGRDWRGLPSSTINGHHPVEISAVLKAARQATKGRVIAVHQPHRFTRLHDLFEDFCTCFNDADVVVIADVYAGGRGTDQGCRP